MGLPISTVVLPIALGVIMLGLGLSLRIADFTRVLAFPRPVIVGLAWYLFVQDKRVELASILAMEPRVVLAEYDSGTDRITVRLSSQMPSSTRDAIANARLNGISNARFLTGKVEDRLERLFEQGLALRPDQRAAFLVEACRLLAERLVRLSWKGKPLAARAGPYRIGRGARS